ncbi:hypothetical protein [Rhizobium sp. 007]|uniref:hypothetical protein n=1 Tax=Rhizobium sp. 007 TaxID=2785056 RepID=UPI00188DF00B|nr:hypothetical protein [Rhizobium sp. 007]QPB18247.1 hypothetical protein ISN39_11065 [Rhizobium sp. 007]
MSFRSPKPALSRSPHRQMMAIEPGDNDKLKELEGLLTLDGTKFRYFTGVSRPELVCPDSYVLDQYYLDLPGRKAAQVALLLDYRTNPPQYPVGKPG